MDVTNSSASTLARSRASIAILAAGAATLSYFVYRAVFDPPLPEPSQRLHRSNAVRRRQRSITQQPPELPDIHDDEDGDSFTSAESPGDIHTVRPLADGETVAAEEQAMDDEWWHDTSQIPQPRAGQNIVSLLFRVSEDNARRNAYVHRGCQCNACGVTPIRGIRYRCANCADFDLCETCESQGLHIKTHIFYKVKIPAPPFGPRQMQPVWYPGDPETSLRTLPRALMTKLSKETGFERPELEAFWEQWTFLANTEWRDDPDDLYLAMDRRTFERCLVPSGGYRHTAPSLIHDRMFSFYDTNNDDLIGFSEFLYGLSFRKRKDKLRKIFEGYDIDKDGYVTRRDFLRIFRAYYVLYKQMHKDILEGLDDQVMSSTEAQQLITSRQPLSSLFGREGRVPPADDERPMPGKVFFGNGDIALSSGKNVINEDQPDTADRQAILSNLLRKDESDSLFVEDAFTPISENALSAPAGNSDSTYWTAVIYPPTGVGQLEALLNGDSDQAQGLFDEQDHEITALRELPVGHSDSHGDDPTENGIEGPDGLDGDESIHDGPRVNFIPEFANTPTHHRQNSSHSPFDRSERLKKRRSRTNTRKKLLDRWRRRQFYLDEEEGAAPPEGWKEDDDVLLNPDAAGYGAKLSQIPLSPRSRSSSKVRFAEDTDDFEIRSNPSTSSRSVPERWGGMDIPDAERDAGKEILYQVTQQAFNELLDIVFKAKEDLAVRCGETREIRDKYRPLYSAVAPQPEPAELQAAVLAASGNSDPLSQSLPELLLRSGYTVDESLRFQAAPTGEASDPIRDLISDIDEDMRPATASEHKDSEPVSAAAWAYRDPTMPQFRPNSHSDVALHRRSDASFSSSHQPEDARIAATGEDKPSLNDENKTQPENDENRRPTWTDGAGSSSATSNGAEKKEDVVFTIENLIEWRRLDQAEEEAKKRGGWGKLSYEEFEQIYKDEEHKANRLDYLGSWIDFCIP